MTSDPLRNYMMKTRAKRLYALERINRHNAEIAKTRKDWRRVNNLRMQIEKIRRQLNRYVLESDRQTTLV